MRSFLIRLGLAAALGIPLLAGSALAHPDHKVMGTVTMAAADHVMVKDRDGREHTIKLARTTKVTRDKKTIKVSDIVKGARVVVTVVSDDDFTAKTIEVGVIDAAGRR